MTGERMMMITGAAYSKEEMEYIDVSRQATSRMREVDAESTARLLEQLPH
jgi:hypothetical protein